MKRFVQATVFAILSTLAIHAAFAEDEGADRAPAGTTAKQNKADPNCASCRDNSPKSQKDMQDIERIAAMMNAQNEDKESCRVQVDVSSFPCSTNTGDQELYKSLWKDQWGNNPTVPKQVLTQEEVTMRALSSLGFNDSDIKAYKKRYGKSPLPQLYTQSDLLSYQNFIMGCEKAQRIYKVSNRGVTDTYTFPIGDGQCRQLKAFVATRHADRDKGNGLQFGEGKDSDLMYVPLPHDVDHMSQSEISEAALKAMGLDKELIAALKDAPSDEEKKKLAEYGIDPNKFSQYVADLQAKMADIKKNPHPKWYTSYGTSGEPELRIKMPSLTTKDGTAHLNEIMGQVAVNRIDTKADKQLQDKWAKAKYPGLAKFMDMCYDPLASGAKSVKAEGYEALAWFLGYGADEDSKKAIDKHFLTKADEVMREIAAKGKIRKTGYCMSIAGHGFGTNGTLQGVGKFGSQIVASIIAGVVGGAAAGVMTESAELEGMGTFALVDAMEAGAAGSAARVETSGLLARLAMSGGNAQIRTIFAEGASTATFVVPGAGSTYAQSRATGHGVYDASTAAMANLFVSQMLFQLGSGAAQRVKLATELTDLETKAGQKGIANLTAKFASGTLTATEKKALAKVVTREVAEVANTCAQMSLMSAAEQAMIDNPNGTVVDTLNAMREGCKSGAILHFMNRAGAVAANAPGALLKSGVTRDTIIESVDGKQWAVKDIDRKNNRLVVVDPKDSNKTRVYNLKETEKVLAKSDDSGRVKNVAMDDRLRQGGDNWIAAAKKGDKVYMDGTPVTFESQVGGKVTVKTKGGNVLALHPEDLSLEPVDPATRTAGKELLTRLNDGGHFQKGDQVRVGGVEKAEVIKRENAGNGPGLLTIRSTQTGETRQILESYVLPDTRMNDSADMRTIEKAARRYGLDTSNPSISSGQAIRMAVALSAHNTDRSRDLIEKIFNASDKPETRALIVKYALEGKTDPDSRTLVEHLTGKAEPAAKPEGGRTVAENEPAKTEGGVTTTPEEIRTEILAESIKYKDDALTETEANMVQDAIKQMRSEERGSVLKNLMEDLRKDPKNALKKLVAMIRTCGLRK